MSVLAVIALLCMLVLTELATPCASTHIQFALSAGASALNLVHQPPATAADAYGLYTTAVVRTLTSITQMGKVMHALLRTLACHVPPATPQDCIKIC